MGRRSDPVRVAAAGISGVAAGHAHLKRVDRDGALAEIREIVETLPRERRQAALDGAAAAYTCDDTPWHAEALTLLLAAGADLEQARTVWAARRTFSGLPHDSER